MDARADDPKPTATATSSATASASPTSTPDPDHGMSSLSIFFIVISVIFILVVLGWVITTQLRARRLGLPPPTLSSYNPFASSSRNYPSASGGGVAGWFSDKLGALKNRRGRTSGGGYEEPLTSSGGGGRGRRSGRGFDALDPDGAWDTRVGTEADAYGPGGYYEEQELGLHGSGTGTGPYGGSGYGGQSGTIAAPRGGPPAYDDEDAPRGRSRSRDPPSAFIGGSKAGLDDRYEQEMGRKPQDPFGDAAERSELPLRGVSPRPIDAAGHRTKPSQDDSHSERRSVFREAM
ncbi:MAG: hypothetical protein M1825_000754 [Sarcosagium campestre]|nr:MAG: hypothetical protein M1825_000754 [Sarcosagium campestre]